MDLLVDASNIEPFFSLQLEREIFEITTRLHPKMIPTLLRVARRVLGWIEPLLYTFLRIEVGETKDAYAGALWHALASKPLDFFPNAARKMIFSNWSSEFFGQRKKNVWSDPELEHMFRMCPGITDLFITGELQKSLLPLFETMQPIRLTMGANIVEEPLDFGFLFFLRLTHFHLFGLGNSLPADWPGWRTLSRLPALTHLVVAGAGVGPLLLANLPRLRVIVLYIKDRTEVEEVERMRDPRIVVVNKSDKFMADWNLRAQGSDDAWVHADAFISRAVWQGRMADIWKS
ncbi:hypothetical protein DFH07DRAFT_959916 [Mycena maculata]|uniref:Uncharacterized protein n=1 Tax=Mycena maculata TaxID=230809 RepID=A0AAD7J0D3_9AGAR|nr:hypothetical protein DFH07DRAFT_959916 [Mycena maculata]